MPKVTLNPLIKQIYGKSGKLIYRRTPKGETIVYQAPERPADASASPDPARKQLWTEAHVYAREAMADPEMSEYYRQEARRLHRHSAYNAAFTSYLQNHKRTGE
jgi:hypothetical protein